MRRRIWLWSMLLACCMRGAAAETNGFAVKFTVDGKSDTMVLPNLWLYVEQGKPPTPFLPGGKFTAVFEGVIIGDLRANFFFKAEELSGAVKLEVNDAVVLEAAAPGALSKAVQINKGPNAVRATFTSPAKGDAGLRIGWTEKGTNANPIPNAWIAHSATPELKGAQLRYHGRELFFENRCAKCHTGEFTAGAPELAMDAPTFEGIGARRSFAWMAEWIENPKATRAQVQMPKLLHGATAKEDAEAIAAYLASLKNGPKASSSAVPPPSGNNDKAIAEIAKRSGVNAKPVSTEGEEAPVEMHGEKQPIFARLHCAACHIAPESTDADATKIGLKHVAAKFGTEASLTDFLRTPERHFAWIRMPNFKLADAEAKELAALLFKASDKAEAKEAPGDKAVIERGQKLVASVGCLNCHAGPKLENSFTAPAKLTAGASGCLAEKHDGKSKAADFAFTPAEREALLAFMKTDRVSLTRHSPLEFASREMRALNCAACHGQIDLVPPLEVLGGKLKPEWAAAFLEGAPFKVRADIHPKGELWVEARMPAFKQRGRWLAEGMAMQHGYAPKTPAEGPIDEEAAKIGHKMIGKDNGLSCISCHAVNDLPALEVFESEGTNLGLAGARLLKPYFFRWMRNPLGIDPQTKMPAYFEDGRSALTDYYEGDAEKQIHALYEYMRQGAKMATPATGL